MKVKKEQVVKLEEKQEKIMSQKPNEESVTETREPPSVPNTAAR